MKHLINSGQKLLGFSSTQPSKAIPSQTRFPNPILQFLLHLLYFKEQLILFFDIMNSPLEFACSLIIECSNSIDFMLLQSNRFDYLILKLNNVPLQHVLQLVVFVRFYFAFHQFCGFQPLLMS